MIPTWNNAIVPVVVSVQLVDAIRRMSVVRSLELFVPGESSITTETECQSIHGCNWTITTTVASSDDNTSGTSSNLYYDVPELDVCLPTHTKEALLDPMSPQSLAFQWLVEHPFPQ